MPASIKRDLVEQLVGRAASDGDGVKLKRIFGGTGAERFDPFLMLDEFGSDQAADYVGGFPRTRTGALKPSPICSKAGCCMKITSATAACSNPAVCSG